MTQTNVTTDNGVKFEGRCVYPGVPSERMSKVCEETNGINFGRGVALATDTAKVRTLKSNQAVLTISTALTASNVLAGNIVINGATSAYTETYATSSPATMELLRAELQALTGISTATLAADNLSITLVADAETDIYFSSGAVTGGSAVTVTTSNDESADVFGVSLYSERQPDSDGNALYLADETVTIGREIYVDMVSDSALAVGDSVFIRFVSEAGDDEKAGMLTSSAGSAPVKAKSWVNAEVYNGCAAGGIASIRVRV